MSDGTTDCRHGARTCAACRRARRLRELLRFIRAAELAAGVHLPVCAEDLDPSIRPPRTRRRPRRR